MTNYYDNARAQFVNYIAQNRPHIYQLALQKSGGARMGETEASEKPGFFSSLFTNVKDLALTVYGSKTQERAEEREFQRIMEANKQAAIAAQRDAVSAIQQQQYAQQIAAIQREQNEAIRSQQDTILMIGGFVLAALVGAKLLKII